MTRSSPLDALGLPPTATEQQLKARWRELAARHHPDRGGSEEEFNRVRQAYTEALVLVRAPVRCQVCHGEGRVPIQAGWYLAKTRCNTCHGTGKVKRRTTEESQDG